MGDRQRQAEGRAAAGRAFEADVAAVGAHDVAGDGQTQAGAAGASRRGVAYDFLPLEESQQLELLDGDTELLPGLWVRRTGGHTAGHQMVYLESDGEKAACLGDVLPTVNQLTVHYMTAYDLYPLETLDAKRHWLSQAEQENWLLIFGHGIEEKAGRLIRRGGRLSLASYDMDRPT